MSADAEGSSADVATDLEVPRKAERLAFDVVQEGDSSSWDRARDEEVVIDLPEDVEPGAFHIRVGDGDVHDVILVEDSEGHVGWCDCDGFTFHSDPDDERLDGEQPRARPCAHLCAVRQRSVLDAGLVPDVDGNVLRSGDPSGPKTAPEPTVEDAETDDTASESPDETDSEDANPGVEVVESEEVPPDERQDVEDEVAVEGSPWAQQLGDVPERFVVQMHGEPHIRRSGYAALANAAGLAVDVEAEVAADSTSFEYARYRARVSRDGEEVASDVGTAHVDREDLAGAEHKLDELAATRALKRALEWATGAGRTAALQEGEP